VSFEGRLDDGPTSVLHILRVLLEQRLEARMVAKRTHVANWG